MATTTRTGESVTSADGTRIVFDRHIGGDAGAVILIGGAFGWRKFPKMVQLGEWLAHEHRLTVLNYDRRGRGDSSAGTPEVYDVEREIEDIAALVEAAGGSAALFGWSSGAALALRAAGSGQVPGVTRVVAFEPPFVTRVRGSGTRVRGSGTRERPVRAACVGGRAVRRRSAATR